MNDNIDQIYLINKILQLNDRLNTLEKKMLIYENNNKNLFQQSTSNSLNNIQNLNNNDNILYDPLNMPNNNINLHNNNSINMQNNSINMQNNSINMQNNSINMQNNNEINKIYDPLSN
jgi:hypothetical protein